MVCLCIFFSLYWISGVVGIGICLRLQYAGHWWWQTPSDTLFHSFEGSKALSASHCKICLPFFFYAWVIPLHVSTLHTFWSSSSFTYFCSQVLSERSIPLITAALFTLFFLMERSLRFSFDSDLEYILAQFFSLWVSFLRLEKVFYSHFELCAFTNSSASA